MALQYSSHEEKEWVNPMLHVFSQSKLIMSK